MESENDVNCYTDSGFNQNEAFHLHPYQHNTVLQAKVFAVEKTTTFLLGSKIEFRKIMINCVSQAAIKAINYKFIKKSTTPEATKALNPLGGSDDMDNYRL